LWDLLWDSPWWFEIHIPAYLQFDDDVSDDEDCNQCWVDEVDIINIEGLVTMDEDVHCDDVNVLKGLFAPMN
jgi:hypothetical protein